MMMMMMMMVLTMMMKVMITMIDSLKDDLISNYSRTSRYGHLSNTDTSIMDSFQCPDKILIYFL